MFLVFFYIIHSFCGFVSQEKLLQLTTRKSDLEFQMNEIKQKRMELKQKALTLSGTELSSLWRLDSSLQFLFQQLDLQLKIVKAQIVTVQMYSW